MPIFSRHRSSTHLVLTLVVKKRKKKTKNHRGRQAIPLKSWRFWRVRGYVLRAPVRPVGQAGGTRGHRPAGQPDDDGDGRAWLRQVINHHHHHHLSKDTHRSPIRHVIGFLSICPFSSRLALSSCCSSYLHYFARGDARLLLVRPGDDMDVPTISLIFAIIFFLPRLTYAYAHSYRRRAPINSAASPRLLACSIASTAAQVLRLPPV
jgi:hypothetical protein